MIQMIIIFRVCYLVFYKVSHHFGPEFRPGQRHKHRRLCLFVVVVVGVVNFWSCIARWLCTKHVAWVAPRHRVILFEQVPSAIA